MAFRVLVPIAAAFTAGSVWMGNPFFLLVPLAAMIFPAEASVAAAVSAALLTSGVAHALAPRTVRGMAGWINHLPVSEAQRRRAAVLGLGAALIPWSILVVGAAATVVRTNPEATLLRLAALPLLVAGCATSALPIRRTGRLVGAAAAGCAWIGDWWMIPVAAIFLVVADRWAGGLRTMQPGKGRRRRIPIAGPETRITLRAMGWRLPAAGLASALIVVPALLFVTNNQLTMGQERLAIRLAGLLAVVFPAALSAEALSVRRPPWPWSRSLPVSPARRVVMDAAFLASVGLPALVVSCFWLWSAIPVVASVPFIALRAAAGVRRAPGHQGGASGPMLAEGSIAAMAVGLVPWSALVCVMLTPLALRWAIQAERRHDVSGWHELQHLAAGDPAAWSES